MGEAAIGSRKLIVEVVGDSRSLERAFSRSSNATNRFGNEVTGTVAKVDSSFTRMQRVMAGGFIGGAVATTGIAALRSVVDAASESEQVLGQTQVALESAGLSWEQYGTRIQKAIDSQSRLGFDDEALLRSFSLFVRQSGSVDEALRRNAIATNLARARFLDLEQAAALVNKAALGQAGALRRVGIDARTGASGVELLAQLEREFAGSAEAASGTAAAAQERLAVSFENVQESLGTLLLPSVISLATALSDAAEGASRLVDELSGIGDVEIPVIDIPLNFTIPGTDSKVGRTLLEVFKRTNPYGFIQIAADIANQFDEEAIVGVNQAAARFEDVFQSFTEGLEAAATSAAKKAGPPSFGEAGFKPLESNDLGEKLQRQFDGLIDSLSLDFDRAEVTAGTADELAVLAETEAAIRKRMESQGRTTALARQLFQVQQQRAGIFEELDRQAQQTAQEERERAKRRREERARAAAERAREQAEATQARQFRALGLDAEGEKPVPVVANLRKQLAQLTDRLVDEGEMTPKIRAQLNKIGKVLKGSAGKVTEDTRETIKDMFSDIRQVFGEESGKDLVPDIRAVELTDKILNALGFGPEGDVAAKIGTDKRRFSAARGGSTLTAPPPQVFTGPITVVADDPDAFLRAMQKKAARTTATSRGRFPGKSMGLA